MIVLRHVPLFSIIAAAQQTLLISDMPQYADLVSCASIAVSRAMGDMSSDCNAAAQATGVASCYCLKNDNSAAMTRDLASQISYWCDKTDSNDLSSVQALFSAYCSPVVPITAAAPQVTSVSYLTDVPAFLDLAPCATLAISNALQEFNGICNLGSQSAASCLCLEDNNSAALSSTLVSDVSYWCGETARDDLTSVLQIQSLYCKPVVPIATQASPPITSFVYFMDMPGYSNLISCAKLAVTGALNDLSNDCNYGAAPATVASCLCLKDNDSAAFSSSLDSEVSYWCGETARDDLTSVLALQSSYCNLVQKLSPVFTAPNAAASALSPAQPGGSRSFVPTPTPTGAGNSQTSQSPQSAGGGGGSNGNAVTLGTSIGIGLPSLIVAIVGLYLWWSKHRNSRSEPSSSSTDEPP